MEKYGAKRKRKVVEIQYNGGESETLKVTKLTGKYMSSMGVPCRSGYELYPEEAVYLVETGSAEIRDEKGTTLDILQSLGILKRMGVTQYRYNVYKQLKRTGLVVLRPRPITSKYDSWNFPEAECSTSDVPDDEPDVMKPERMETEDQHLIIPNNFASFSRSNYELELNMNYLHTKKEFVNFLDNIIWLRMHTNISKIVPPNIRSPCRPKEWAVQKTNDWREFKDLKREKLKIRQWSLNPNLKSKSERTSVNNVDFHVFSPASFSHRLPARPIFSIICYQAVGGQTPIDIASLSNMENVIMAIEELGKVNFVSISGGSIDLNTIMEEHT